MKGKASELCARFHMGSTATFSIRLYSEDGAQRLAQLWCHRMQWFLQLWQAHDRDEGFRFGEHEISMYEEPEVGFEIAGELGVVFNRRLAAIRAIKPS